MHFSVQINKPKTIDFHHTHEANYARSEYTLTKTHICRSQFLKCIAR